jgi:hypothetical protein
MLVGPSRKHPAFTFGPNVGPGNLDDIRDAKRPHVSIPRQSPTRFTHFEGAIHV